jgi:aryl-alcohol dehydrogenase-like predicted oxidoreductase
MTTSEPAYPAPRFALPMGSDAQLTRIVYGTAALFTYPDPLVVLDAAYDAGITAFDCAAIYGLGMCETIVGHWMKVRNLARERVVLISKGGHPTIGLGRTRVDEECIRADLDASLTRLCVAYVDIYLLHRDDERVPVERVCEWMDRLVSGGKVKYWGVSNWTIGRIRQAVDYATHKGLVPPRYDSEHVSPMIPESTLYDGVPLIDPRNRVEELIPLNIRLLAWAPLAEGCCCHAQSLSKRHKRAYGGAVNTSIRHALIAIAVQRGDSMARCALAYTLACSEELCVVVGTGRVSHVYDTMLSITRPLDSAQCETIRKCFPYRAHRRPTPLEIPT